MSIDLSRKELADEGRTYSMVVGIAWLVRGLRTYLIRNMIGEVRNMIRITNMVNSMVNSMVDL